MGFSNAAATMVGQNLGALQPERAEKSVWRTGFFNAIFMGIVMIVFLFFSDDIADFFTDEKDVVESAAQCLNIFSLGYFLTHSGWCSCRRLTGRGYTHSNYYESRHLLADADTTCLFIIRAAFFGCPGSLLDGGYL